MRGGCGWLDANAPAVPALKVPSCRAIITGGLGCCCERTVNARPSYGGNRRTGYAITHSGELRLVLNDAAQKSCNSSVHFMSFTAGDFNLCTYHVQSTRGRAFVEAHRSATSAMTQNRTPLPVRDIGARLCTLPTELSRRPECVLRFLSVESCRTQHSR